MIANVKHPRHQKPQGDADAKTRTLQLITISLVCTSDINEARYNRHNPFFDKNIRRQKHLRRWMNAETGISTFTHWGRVTHICVGNLAIIGSDDGLSPGRRQAIIRSNAGILLIGSLGTNFSEIWIGVQTFSLKKIRLKISSAKRRPFCLGFNVLITS